MTEKTKKPESATEGQFRDFVAKLIMRQPSILPMLEKEGMQKIINEPSRFENEFAEFINHAGVFDGAHIINCSEPSPVGLHGDYHHSNFSPHEDVVWGNGNKIQLLPICDFVREPFLHQDDQKIHGYGAYSLDFKKIHEYLASIGKILVNGNVFLYLRQRPYLLPEYWSKKVIVFLGSRCKKDESQFQDEKCGVLFSDYSITPYNLDWGSFHYGNNCTENSLCAGTGYDWTKPGTGYIAVL